MVYIYKSYQVFLYNEQASCTLYTSCAQVAILLLQDLSVSQCVTDIYDMYGIYYIHYI